MSLAHWTGALIAPAETWLLDTAATNGHPLTGDIERVHVRPWSIVFRAPTATAAVFLKICHRVQAHEPLLTEIVARDFPSLGPDLIARHPTEPWMLMGDGGIRLRDARTGQAFLDTWTELLPRYAELQRVLAGRESELRAAGVPDRRLDRLARLLGAIVADERAAPADIRARIGALLPTIGRSCAELEAFGIGPSIDHADLHDNNVLVRDRRIAIVDWGDAGVTHPFLSQFVTLRFVTLAAGIDIASPSIKRLRDAYLEPWTGELPRTALDRAADLGLALGSIAGALTWYRITQEIAGVEAESVGDMAAELGRISAAFERIGS